MKLCTVIQTELGQAVVLSEAVAFSDDVKLVDVVAIGRARIVTPAGESWESWFDCAGAGADGLPERDQPTDQERNPLDHKAKPNSTSSSSTT